MRHLGARGQVKVKVIFSLEGHFKRLLDQLAQINSDLDR